MPGPALILSRQPVAVAKAIEEADALVVCTPTDEGSYTGQFKHLIDFIDPATPASRQSF